MKHGPVASEAKNIAEESSRLDRHSRAYARRYLRRNDPYHFSTVAEVDQAVLSKTDREALDFAWQTFGHYTEFRLRDITHHYPEWKRRAHALRTGHLRVTMNYSDFFADPEPGYNPCHELSAKERAAALELFCDRQAFDARWS